MREILFKGKRIDNEEWLEGDLMHNPYQTIHINGFIVKSETVGQYTGLKDKNGNKIFEGDKIRVCDNKNGYFKVEFKNQYAGGWVLTHEEGEISLGARKQEDIEIIGNIHDEEEL